MSEQLVKRLRELSNAVTRADWNEFSMRIPVEKDRDADFVLLQAADKIAALEADAARYRLAIAKEDNAEALYAAVLSCGPIYEDVCAHFDDEMKGGA